MKKPATKGSKKRRVTKEQIIVLLDGEGHFYEIPREQLEQSRVPAEREEDVKKELRDKTEESEFIWIHRTAVPGSIAAAAKEFDGGRVLHYAGYTLRSIKSKR
jgi:hypothetical protein